MAESYGAIAGSIVSLAKLEFRIYDDWASAPDICGRASRQLGSVNLALRRIAAKVESSARNPLSTLVRSGDAKQAELADLLALLMIP